MKNQIKSFGDYLFYENVNGEYDYVFALWTLNSMKMFERFGINFFGFDGCFKVN